jgi:hypothetical protein
LEVPSFSKYRTKWVTPKSEFYFSPRLKHNEIKLKHNRAYSSSDSNQTILLEPTLTFNDILRVSMKIVKMRVNCLIDFRIVLHFY